MDRTEKIVGALLLVAVFAFVIGAFFYETSLRSCRKDLAKTTNFTVVEISEICK